MKKIINTFLTKYNNLTLVQKIRYMILIIMIPMTIFILFSFYSMWKMNKQFEEMIDSTVAASEFSFDFKKDLDYETYLVIVGNKSYEESDIEAIMSDAERVVSELENITLYSDNKVRLDSVKKYLKNLRIYLDRIKKNYQEENLYEENMQIWENDVQIVSTLIEDTITEYIYYDVKYIQQERIVAKKNFNYLISIALVVFAILLILITYTANFLPKSISRPIRRITEVTNKVAEGDLSVRSDVTDGVEATMLSTSLNKMIDKINELLSQVTTEQIRLRKAEFELLQSQINPHFLYNTLDAIVWLAEAGDKEKVVSTVKSLSDFFRTSLNQGKDIVSIREELLHVKSYLDIQRIRYQDILEYEINVPEELNIYRIPKITIQPLVENALYHGIKNKRGLGKITVTGELRENDFIICVADNGMGITEERLEQVMHSINHREDSEKQSFGLYNVNERIRLDFGVEYGISISSKYKEGTQVTVRLPLQEEQS